jgi:hypothetical protein
MLTGRIYYWQEGSSQPVGCDIFLYIPEDEERPEEHVTYCWGDCTDKMCGTVIKHRNNTMKIVALTEDKIRISEYKKKHEPYERTFIEFANLKWHYDDIIEYNGIDVL